MSELSGSQALYWMLIAFPDARFYIYSSFFIPRFEFLNNIVFEWIILEF